MDFIDTHCHIQSIGITEGERTTRELWAKRPDLSQESVVVSAREAGVSRMIVVGCTLDDSKLAIETAAKFDGLSASIGIHPHEAKEYAGQTALLDAFAALLEDNPQSSHASVGLGDGEKHSESYREYGERASQPATTPGAASVGSASGSARRQADAVRKIVAVGECGLDYYYGHSPKEDQIELLKFQIEVAIKHNLPLIFHVRDAFDDFWPIFDSYKGKIRGVLHSFTDNQTNLERAIKAGLYIGVNGIATFAKKEEQLAVYRAIPLHNLLLETDAPFLTPVPHRGTMCEPKHVRDTAAFLSNLRSESLEVLASATTQNAQKLFGL